jgi:hypothetical protein
VQLAAKRRHRVCGDLTLQRQPLALDRRLLGCRSKTGQCAQQPGEARFRCVDPKALDRLADDRVGVTHRRGEHDLGQLPEVAGVRRR